jgi:hypothetical protein
MHVHEPSVLELTIEDHVQLDQLTPCLRGYVAQRHGALLHPGVATLALGRGFYFFKTASNANLKVVRGGIDVVTASSLPSSRGVQAAAESPIFTLS